MPAKPKVSGSVTPTPPTSSGPVTPKAKPATELDLWKARLAHAGHDYVALTAEADFLLVLSRGLFSKSVGEEGNDINAYDDGAVLFHGGKAVGSWNANTDPTRYGWNPHADDYMARLKPGAYWMKHRRHGAGRPSGGYWAFGQCERPVTVERIAKDGTIMSTNTGCFGIDLHPGGTTSTSSEGCITIKRDQWDSLYTALRSAGWFRVVLIDMDGMPGDLK